ncbi:ATP-binding protein [Lacinutrix iliipiscaria]|uniref:histidine kinase n=1 Tax=Lacinutrix iliipiscaria TaxID=1230532 RepID=A0ABW5WKF0_9FLAO
MRKLITLICFFTIFLGYSQTEELESLYIQVAFQDPDTTKVNTSIRIIKILYKENDYDKALKYIRESEKLSNDLKYTTGIAEIAYYKGLIFSKKEDYINAVDSYVKSKELYTTLADTLGVARINNSLALIEIERGNYDKGLQLSLSAMKELEKRGLKKELRDSYKNLATAYNNMKADNQAIEFFEKTLDLEDELSNKEGIIEANKSLGDLYASQNDYQRAIYYYDNVLLNIDDSDSILRGDVLTKLGYSYLQLNNLEDAKEYLTQGLRLNRRLNNHQGVLTALNATGDLYLRERKSIIAERLLSEATDLGRTLKNNDELINNYRLRAKLDSLENDFRLAYIWQKRHFDLKNQVERRRIAESESLQNQSISTIENTKDLSVSAREENKALISQHEKEKKASQDEIDRLKFIFYLLLIALAITSTFLILIYLKRNNSIKYTKELEDKNRQINLQNEAILDQSKNLEDINQVKDKLFSIVSHDLKDSLTSIKGFIDLLKDGSLSQEEFNHLIPELSENANNASLLLFNLLNWSKSQMQSLESKPSLFDVQEVFSEKIKLIEQKTEKKGIKIEDLSLRDFVYADRSMVEIIIQNLLTNAVKFCKAGDTITIANHISNGNSLISITDTGVGISKENQDQLFKNNSFTTIGTKNEKGTGLGLTICKELVELNHGKIWVESTEHVGSTFYVELPKSNPQA